MSFGVGDALVEQPGVYLVVGLEPQALCQEAFADEFDLVLDLPPGCWRAGDWLDQVMTAHLQEAAIVEAAIADKDLLHRRLMLS